ncbi:Regulatory protein OS=Streptomyces microflavus OX=1919 GN=Smic_82040 PE=4 SV=1 [Streptomyces microflavus]
MDLVTFNRRGFVVGAALAAGSTIAGPMYEWLHSNPAPAADAPRANDPQHADPAGFNWYEAAPVGSEEIEALEHSVEVFR